jgi:hypothetical protein
MLGESSSRKQINNSKSDSILYTELIKVLTIATDQVDKKHIQFTDETSQKLLDMPLLQHVSAPIHVPIDILRLHFKSELIDESHTTHIQLPKLCFQSYLRTIAADTSEGTPDVISTHERAIVSTKQTLHSIYSSSAVSRLTEHIKASVFGLFSLHSALPSFVKPPLHHPDLVKSYALFSCSFSLLLLTVHSRSHTTANILAFIRWLTGLIYTYTLVDSSYASIFEHILGA